MAKSLKDLKKNRQATLESMQKQVEQENNDGGSAKEGWWKPSKNKEGTFMKVIRFLPAPPDGDFGEEVAAYVKTIRHNFRGPKGYYNESSLTVLGKNTPDPVAKFQNFLWNDIGTKDAKKQYANQKRSIKYVSNILVLKDPENPENEGKVFLYEYPKTVFDKISNYLTPPKDAMEEPVNIFCPWEGMNFRLQTAIKKDPETGNEFPDYSLSTFQKQSELAGGDDDKIDEIWQQCQSLQQFVNPDNKDYFKTYEELEAQLCKIFDVDSLDDLMTPDYKPFIGGAGYKRKNEKDAIAKMEEDSGATDLSGMLDDEEEEEEAVSETPKKAAAKKTAAKTSKKAKEPEPEVDEDELTSSTFDDEDEDLQDLADLDDLDSI